MEGSYKHRGRRPRCFSPPWQSPEVFLLPKSEWVRKANLFWRQLVILFYAICISQQFSSLKMSLEVLQIKSRSQLSRIEKQEIQFSLVSCSMVVNYFRIFSWSGNTEEVTCVLFSPDMAVGILEGSNFFGVKVLEDTTWPGWSAFILFQRQASCFFMLVLLLPPSLTRIRMELEDGTFL